MTEIEGQTKMPVSYDSRQAATRTLGQGNAPMSDASLSPRVLAKLQSLVAPADQPFAAEWLASECGTGLPLLGPDTSAVERTVERIQTAVLKLSGGSLDSLATWTKKAAIDWRDVLLAAEFADDARAHEAWLADETRPHDRPA